VSNIIQVLSYSKRYYRDDRILKKLFLEHAEKNKSTSLDIGSGPIPKNPFGSSTLFGADFRENKENKVIYADLSNGVIPFDDNRFNFVTAFDVLEHIPRISHIEGKTEFPLIQLLNEVFRILKPGGIFFSSQPVFPAKSAFQDPTHVNIMSEDTLDLYFCERAWARIYGFTGSFELIEDGWVGDKYFCLMRKLDKDPVLDLHFKQL
jgi:SAM-dependent methyltransferase